MQPHGPIVDPRVMPGAGANPLHVTHLHYSRSSQKKSRQYPDNGWIVDTDPTDHEPSDEPPEYIHRSY